MLSRATAALCLLLPAAADMLPLTPEMCVAVWQEPYCHIAEQGAPLPPTPLQVRALPPLLFAQQQAAVKETLLLRWCLIRAAHHRSDARIEEQCAGLARAAEAPEPLADIFQRFADGTLTSVEAHAWNAATEQLMEAYRVDALAVRLLAEQLDIPAEQVADAVADLSGYLPWADAFNALPLQPPSAAEMLADCRCMERDYAELACLYAGVQDKESAEHAAEAGLPALRRLLTTARTLFALQQAATQLTPEQSDALKRANAAYAELNAERSRLRQHAYFGSLRLHALDVLAD